MQQRRTCRFANQQSGTVNISPAVICWSPGRVPRRGAAATAPPAILPPQPSSSTAPPGLPPPPSPPAAATARGASPALQGQAAGATAAPHLRLQPCEWRPFNSQCVSVPYVIWKGRGRRFASLQQQNTVPCQIKVVNVKKQYKKIFKNCKNRQKFTIFKFV